jgi:hypothetical protein
LVVLAFAGWFAPVATRASGGTADALASGASVRKDVGVQIPPRALIGNPASHLVKALLQTSILAIR